MTTQQRDTDFAHVRVGTVFAFREASDRIGGIQSNKPYCVDQIDRDAYFRDDRGNDRLVARAVRWREWGGYIISQPGEAPQTTSERTDTDRLNWLSRRNVTVTELRRYGFGDTFEVGPDNDLDQFELDAWDGLREAIDAAIDREGSEQVATPQATATSEAATRDKALEDAARVCDEFLEHSASADGRYAYGRVGTAIRQMKGAVA